MRLFRKLAYGEVCFLLARAHASQKGTPKISTDAGRGQGRSVLLRTWHGPGFVGAE